MQLICKQAIYALSVGIVLWLFPVALAQSQPQMPVATTLWQLSTFFHGFLWFRPKGLEAVRAAWATGHSSGGL